MVANKYVLCSLRDVIKTDLISYNTGWKGLFDKTHQIFSQRNCGKTLWFYDEFSSVLRFCILNETKKQVKKVFPKNFRCLPRLICYDIMMTSPLKSSTILSVTQRMILRGASDLNAYSINTTEKRDVLLAYCSFNNCTFIIPDMQDVMKETSLTYGYLLPRYTVNKMIQIIVTSWSIKTELIVLHHTVTVKILRLRLTQKLKNYSGSEVQGGRQFEFHNFFWQDITATYITKYWYSYSHHVQ